MHWWGTSDGYQPKNVHYTVVPLLTGGCTGSSNFTALHVHLLYPSSVYLCQTACEALVRCALQVGGCQRGLLQATRPETAWNQGPRCNVTPWGASQSTRPAYPILDGYTIPLGRKGVSVSETFPYNLIYLLYTVHRPVLHSTLPATTVSAALTSLMFPSEIRTTRSLITATTFPNTLSELLPPNRRPVLETPNQFI